MKLTDHYQYESEEVREQQTSKKPDKKELLAKPSMDDSRKFNEWANKKETDINRELFQKHFNFQSRKAVLKAVYTILLKKLLSLIIEPKEDKD